MMTALLALPVFMASGAAGPDDWNSLASPSRMQIAFETHTRRATDNGRLPLWNPYHLGGRPHLADPATLAVYPPHAAFRLLLPLETFFRVSFVLHAWVFGAGAYLLGRHLGSSPAAAVLASLGAMLATVVTPGADLLYSPTVYSTAWLPLLVVFAMRSVRRPTKQPHGGLVFTGVMAMTGLPRGQVFALGAIVCCYLFAAAWPDGTSRRTLLAQAGVLAILLAGLSAFALVPHLRLWSDAARTGGLAREDLRIRPTYDSSPRTDRLLASIASAKPGFRVMSQCREVVDGSRFLPLGVPTTDGYGGAFLADYGRFANIVSDTRGAAAAAPATLTGAIRIDLLRFLNVGSIVDCARPAEEQSETGEEWQGAIVTHPASLPRAFWTCAPHRATRDEIDYLLKSFRYDEALTLREPNPVVHLRWAPDLDPPARLAAESGLKLRQRRYVDGTTWQYDLLDSTRANLAAIVNHPSVEDTAGFERGALALPPPPEFPALSNRGSEWILGVEECQDARPAAIERLDRHDGHFVATVDAPRDGVVFLSETFSPQRTAWVDGARVDTLKVNYAFTGIPVTAGAHRVELRADPGPFRLGAATTALTLIGWVAFAWVRRPR